MRVLPRHSSDHSPLLLSTDFLKENRRHDKKLFQSRKFKVMWLDHEEDNKIIVDSWGRGAGLNFQERLSETMHAFGEWHK